MKGNGKSSSHKRHFAGEYKRKGPSKKVKGNNDLPEHDKPFGDSSPSDTVYRILCPSRKIGGVIGKAGGIINSLREETKAKITVNDLVSGSDERVIMISSSPTKNSKLDQGDENEDEIIQLHCAAQDALMRVHGRIIEEDIFGGVRDEGDDDSEVTARLLVPSNLVGCIIGKGGEIIQRLRGETGASIRVLPKDHVPTCAMITDELVQISGKPSLVKRALYEVSTRLHQNPRKDRPPNVSTSFTAQVFHPHAPTLANRASASNTTWLWQNPASRTPPEPWMGGFRNPSPGVVSVGYHDSPIRRGGEPLGEFSMKLLCIEEKIGGVIGKGGMNVKQLQHETGASIHVEEASTECNERVIHVSAIETLADPRSQTIDAILLLQPKASEFSDKGIITTRILVSSSKIGCIIGEGGSIISEMRWRTKAAIRVHSKDDRPKCASKDDELVQVSGSFAVAKDALAEIASRLRIRSLRNSNTLTEPTLKPVRGYAPPADLPSRHPISLEVGSSQYKGGVHILEQSYPVQRNTSRYLNASGSVQNNYAYDAVVPSYGTGGSSMIEKTTEAAGSRLTLQDPLVRGHDAFAFSDRINAVQNIPHAFTASQAAGSRLALQNPQDRARDALLDVRASGDHLNAVQNIPHVFTASRHENISQQGLYPDPSTQLSSHMGMTHHDSYQHSYAQTSYQNNHHTQQRTYQYPDSQHIVYQNVPVLGSYEY